jgi:catechol 2,3-dioxygenase-like lactoylglutathione lyase family enzyme
MDNAMPIELLVDTPEFGIVTHNMEAMRHFYENVVGLNYQEKITFSGGYMHRYHFGSAILKLVAATPPPKMTNPQGAAMSATGYRYATLVVANLSNFVAEVETAGFNASKITDFGNGIGFAFIEDPDGNQLELAGPI